MENSREIAKLKRQCADVAGKIHDVVEENLWTEYSILPELTRELIEKIQIYEAANKECQKS